MPKLNSASSQTDGRRKLLQGKKKLVGKPKGK